MSEYCSACACGAKPRDDPGCELYKGRVRGFLLRFGERTFLLNQSFLRQLKHIVEATSSMPTTRTTIFVSDGFNRFPGRELYGILEGFNPHDRSLLFNPRDTQPQLKAVLQLAPRKDVKFYTLDSRGLYSWASLAGSSFDASHAGAGRSGATPESVDQAVASVGFENGDALSQLAHATGGIFFVGCDRGDSGGRSRRNWPSPVIEGPQSAHS